MGWGFSGNPLHRLVNVMLINRQLHTTLKWVFTIHFPFFFPQSIFITYLHKILHLFETFHYPTTALLYLILTMLYHIWSMSVFLSVHGEICFYLELCRRSLHSGKPTSASLKLLRFLTDSITWFRLKFLGCGLGCTIVVKQKSKVSSIWTFLNFSLSCHYF